MKTRSIWPRSKYLAGYARPRASCWAAIRCWPAVRLMRRTTSSTRRPASRAARVSAIRLAWGALGRRLFPQAAASSSRRPAAACSNTTARIRAMCAPPPTTPAIAGLDDSQWRQWKTITGFYQWCRARGIYLNVPDWYFLAGSSKTGMGYREIRTGRCPASQQEIIERQNIFDGTWEKTPEHGLDVRAADRISGRRRGRHHRAAEGPSPALQARGWPICLAPACRPATAARGSTTPTKPRPW